jgi:Secretion system C-terminal sorting domain
MKKLIFSILLLLSIESHSQITLDFQDSIISLTPIKLTNLETKYQDSYGGYSYSVNQFSLYNLDGTLFKTIQIPPKPYTTQYDYFIEFVSRTLFDIDPTNIEYMVGYHWYDSIGSHREVKIIRDDGTILFDELGATWGGGAIYSTEEGTKMILIYFDINDNYSQTKVFNLPGNLPNSIDDKKITQNNTPILYPNPNNGDFFLNLQSEGNNFNTIYLYSSSGKLISTYKSIGNPIHISTFSLSEGLYFVNSQTKFLNTTTKMIINK